MMLLLLFWEFLKIGMFSFGGGMATIPFLIEVGNRTGWFTTSNVTDMLAISESTPGPIGINMATYVGYHCAGVLGAITATVAIITPSVILVLLVMRVYFKFKENRILQAGLYGMRPASAGLIAAAFFGVVKVALFHTEVSLGASGLLAFVNWKAIALAAIIAIATNIKELKNVHPLVFLLVSAVVGMVFKF